MVLCALLGLAGSLGATAQEGVDLRPVGTSTGSASPLAAQSPDDGRHSGVVSAGVVSAGDVSDVGDPDPKPLRDLPRFRVSDDPDDLVIEFRELRRPVSEEAARRPGRQVYGRQIYGRQIKTWRIYGDGRFERWPEPDPPRDPPMKMAPEALEALLRSLVVLNDLPAHASNEPPPDDRSYLRVHLDRYYTTDWSVAIDYLDALVVEDPQTAFDSATRVGLRASFRELSAVGQWLLWVHPTPSWVSGNPHPTICHPDQRLEFGLPDSVPPWCAYFRSIRGSWAENDPANAERREQIRERLRERLRTLPRGLREPTPEEASGNL